MTKNSRSNWKNFNRAFSQWRPVVPKIHGGDKPSLRSGRSREWRPFVRESVQRDLKSDFAQFRIMVDRGRGIRLYVSRTGCILLGERVGCIPLSKGYRANLNIGRSAVPSGDLPRNRATRSPTCDPFCSFVRSTRPTDHIFFSTSLRETLLFSLL